MTPTSGITPTQFRQKERDGHCSCELRDRQWNPGTGKCQTCGLRFPVPVGKALTRSYSPKHTCGIDGDPGAVTPRGGTCQACIEEITDERLEELRQACQWICGREDYDSVYGNVDIRQVAELLLELREFRAAKRTAPIRYADPDELKRLLLNLKDSLKLAYGQMGGKAMKSSLEQAQKDVDILLERVAQGKESQEATERYKDRLMALAIASHNSTIWQSKIENAADVLQMIDAKCEERNKQ